MMKKTIFWKIFLFLLMAGIIPLLVFTLLEYKSIQDLSSEILLMEDVNEEIVSRITLTGEDTQILILLILFFTSALIILETVLITRSFTSPLKKLSQGVEKARGGDLTVKVNIKTGDELEDLGNAFNQMIEDLNETRKLLEEAKAVLEIRVRARTKELEELTKNLEEQVKEKTKELQKKILELEKFQKFAVGREMKMVELKKEIKKYKEKREENKTNSR